MEYYNHLIIKHRVNKCMFTDHWFMDIPTRNAEVHFGYFSEGDVKPINTMRNAHIRHELYVCDNCMNHIIHKIRLGRKNWLFPMVNCESIANNIVYDIPISFQTIFLTSIAISVICTLVNVNFVFLVLLLVILYLVFLRWLYSGKSKRICKHLVSLLKN